MFLQECTSDLWESFSLSLSLSLCGFHVSTILTNTSIPTPSRGEDKCWCSCQGRACCREDMISKGWGGFWRVGKHTSWALEKRNSSHIHHPTRAPLTSSFLTQRRHLAQAGFVSPNMQSKFLHSFQSILLISSPMGVHYFDKLYFGANYGL